MPSKRSQSSGSRIRELRQQQGLSVRRLAGSAYVDPSTLSRLERGQTIASQLTIAQVARSLQVLPQDIDPCFHQNVVLELQGIEGDIQRIASLQQKISELQGSIARRQRMIVSCLLPEVLV